MEFITQILIAFIIAIGLAILAYFIQGSYKVLSRILLVLAGIIFAIPVLVLIYFLYIIITA
ncbi:hypothetical protein [Streptococcus sp. DD13]|uniref:hypothetical protein n=1 Tax=Streptococcus sp. DD13 TaxID=1777881 RepID=UPI00079C7911|nr:hypothetical protein [Streptococcus sp. DD13]KXT78492.1 hypothetical protein STRDD13_00694 [Streptococcus sp. DD13]